jgi:Xaa-Pro aminopeptidase
MADAALLVGNSETNQNLFYKTRFLAGDPFFYLESGERCVLVVSPMEAGRARKQSTVADVRTFDDFGYRDLVRETNDRPRAFTIMLTRAVAELGLGRLRVEGTLPVLYADALREQGVTLDVDPRLFELARRTKQPHEIEAIGQAQRAAVRAMTHSAELLARSEAHAGALVLDGTPLTSERLRTEIEFLLMREGMDVPLAPIVAGGPGAADPHWEGSGPLRPGEAVVIDLFPRARGARVFGDMTRTFVRGKPPELLRRMYDATSLALDAALAEVRAGANGRDVHEAAKRAFADAGFDQPDSGPRYIHATGHGVGLDIHEAPAVGALDVELLAGDVVTIEPGLYDPEVGAVRIEDLVAVTVGGYQNLTSFPRVFEL